MLSKFDGGKGTQNTPPFDKALKGPSFPGHENAVTKRGEREDGMEQLIKA